MKLNILVLTALAGSAFAGAVSDVETREPAGDLDLDLMGRELPKIDVEVREPVDVEIDVRAVAIPGEPGQPNEAGEPAQPNPRCPPRREARPWVRRGDWPFQTTRYVGWLFRSWRYNTRVVYILFHPDTEDYFYTVSANERRLAIRNYGYESRGFIGFIFRDRRCGGSRLYRMYNPVRRHHFYTTSELERAKAKLNGWNDQQTMGYIFRF